MSVKDLDGAANAVRLYNDLVQATLYAKQWADTVMGLQAQLLANPLYVQSASPADVQFLSDASAVSDAYAKAIPAAPDRVVLAPVFPVVEEVI